MTYKGNTGVVPSRRNVFLYITSYTDKGNSTNEPDAEHSHETVTNKPAVLLVGRE